MACWPWLALGWHVKSQAGHGWVRFRRKRMEAQARLGLCKRLGRAGFWEVRGKLGRCVQTPWMGFASESMDGQSPMDGAGAIGKDATLKASGFLRTI